LLWRRSRSAPRVKKVYTATQKIASNGEFVRKKNIKP